MNNGPLIPHDLAARALEDALRLCVGRGRRHSFAGLADATGISQRALESYVQQGSTPSLAGWLSLCSVLGPGFASDVLKLAGQTAQEADHDAPHHMSAAAAMTALTQQICEAYADDGRVDHREAAAMRPAAQALLPFIQAIAHPPEPTS